MIQSADVERQEAARQSHTPSVRTSNFDRRSSYLTRGGPFAWALLLPALFVMLLVLGFPSLFNLLIGFTNASSYTGWTDVQYVGLENFSRTFADAQFRQSFRITILWTVANLSLQMTLGLLLALILHSAPSRFAKAVQPLWLMPWALPAAAAFMTWRTAFNPSVGQYHQWLTSLGIIDKPLLADPQNAIWAVIAAAVWKGFPFYVVVFYSGLQSVPEELYDAAAVDGANRLRVFRHIEWPELTAIILPTAVMGFIWIFNSLTPIFIMTAGGPGGATMTMAMYIYDQAMRLFRFGSSAVGSTVLIAIVVVMFAILQVLQRDREESR